MSNPYQTSNQFIKANGLSFHYTFEGSEDKPVLALINTASSNLTAWEPVMAALLEHFQILRFDIRGTGKSEADSNGDFTFTQYANDLSSIMDALGISKAFVLGVAYGARTAVRFSLSHPDKLIALGLFDASLTPPVDQKEQYTLAAQAISLLNEAKEPLVERQKYWRFYENRDTALLAHTAHEHEPDITPTLKDVTQPALVVCGRQDINLNESERIAKSLPNSEHHIMEMTGHGSHHFRPALFSKIIIDFSNQYIQ